MTITLIKFLPIVFIYVMNSLVWKGLIFLLVSLILATQKIMLSNPNTLDDLEKKTTNNIFDFLITHGPLEENFFLIKKLIIIFGIIYIIFMELIKLNLIINQSNLFVHVHWLAIMN